MRNKILLTSFVLLVAFALGACSPTIVANPAPMTRTLSVNGAGEALLTPDIAYIYIGVHSEEASATEAVAANNQKTQSVVTALKKAGVAEKDIRTTNFSIWPNTQYGPESQQIGTTYVVDNSVYVTVRDLDGLGKLLDSAVKSGANSINSIQFDVEDKTQAIKEARAAAVANALEQAQELADAAGLKLGEVQNIGFYDSVPTPYMTSFGKGGGGAVAEAASVPIQPGQLTVMVTVNITYELK